MSELLQKILRVVMLSHRRNTDITRRHTDITRRHTDITRRYSKQAVCYSNNAIQLFVRRITRPVRDVAAARHDCAALSVCLSVTHTRINNLSRISVLIPCAQTPNATPVPTGSLHDAAGRSIRRSATVRPPTAVAFGTLTDTGTPVIATPNLSPPPGRRGALLTQISHSSSSPLLSNVFRNKVKCEVLYVRYEKL